MQTRPAILEKRTVYQGWMKIIRVRAQIDSQDVEREVEDHGRVVAILPYDRERRVVLLARQVRVPPLLYGHDAALLEAAAGMVDSEHCEQAASREAREELGLDLKTLEHVAGAWASPGVSTEFMDLYLAPYSVGDRVSSGGGLASEHEKISVVEIPIANLCELLDRRELADLKTLALVMLLRWHRPELFSFAERT